MMSNTMKALKLREAIELLEQVDAIQQEVLGDSDVCWDNHTRLQDLITDFEADVELFKGVGV